MKEALLYMDTAEIHASEFDCDFDGGSDVPVATDQDVLI